MKQVFLSTRPVNILFLSLWFGLVAGFGEVTILLFRKYYQHKLVFLSHHFPWLVLLGDSIIFGIIGIFSFFIFRRKSPGLSLLVNTWLFTTLVSLSFLLRVNRLTTWSIIILAIGLGSVASSLVRAYTSWFYSIVRLTFPIMIFGEIMIALYLLVFIP